MKKATAESVNVAEAKKRFSDLLGRVAYGGATVLITRRGRPMARLVPPGPEQEREGLADIRGWLENGDRFFARVDEVVKARSRHAPRAYGGRRRRGTVGAHHA